MTIFCATEALALDRIPGPVLAKVVSCHDGDTCTVQAEPWPGDLKIVEVRIDGINAAELKGPCPQAAEQAQVRLAELVVGTTVVLTDVQPDKYGRRSHAFPVRAKVATQDGRDVAALMIGAGLAEAYHGRGKARWCPAAGG